MWNTGSGEFTGTAGADVNDFADQPQHHPGLPYWDKLPRTDGPALAILLAWLGYDMPAELKAECEIAWPAADRTRIQGEVQ